MGYWTEFTYHFIKLEMLYLVGRDRRARLSSLADEICLTRLPPCGGVGADWRTETFEVHFADILEQQSFAEA